MPSTSAVATQEVVGVMQVINKAFGAFDEQDEDLLGKPNPVSTLSRGLHASCGAQDDRLSADLSDMCFPGTFLSIAGSHVKTSSVTAASLPA